MSSSKSPGSETDTTASTDTDLDEEILGPLAAAASEAAAQDDDEQQAATRTVNERLLAELQEATDKEKFGARSAVGRKLGLDSFKSSKTDEERRLAIEEAQNLNGVNPVVAITGSIFALGAAAGLWILTGWLGEFFATHPVNSDVYFIQRTAAVFRNVVVGLVALAAGFFGVTGAGIFFLGVKVAIGVAKGELDPTPLKKADEVEDLEFTKMLDLMLNKKPGRRGR